MNNEQLIKSAHIWALVVFVLFVVIVVATKAEPNPDLAQQNANSNANTANQNANQNSNANTATANSNSNASTTTGMSSQERNFMRDVAMSGLLEVELGRMATEKGGSDAVKQFGQKMVDDHSAVIKELTQLAASKGMSLPTELGPKHKAHVTTLSNLSGAEFDKAYAKMMVSNHKKSASAFEKESKGGADAELKAFAAKTLPAVQEHLQMAKALTGTGGSGGSNTNTNSNSNTKP